MAEYGSPLYVTSEAQLRQNLLQLSELVGGANAVAFPVKANPSFEVLRTLALAGAAADCASGYEVRRALACGFAPTSVLYNSPAPDPGLLVQVYNAGGTVIADSVSAIAQLSVGAEPGRGRLLFRVTFRAPVGYDQDQDWKALVAHADPTGKFGIPQEDVPELLSECRIPVNGLHVHVGTLMDNLQAFEASMAALHEMVEIWRNRFSHPLDILNLGGGLGVVFEEDQLFPSRRAFVDCLRRDMLPDITYLIEPGNSLVADACALITRVVNTKNMRGKKWAICDVGSDQLLRATTLSWRSRVLHQGKPLPRQGPDSVGGPLCFAGDVLLPETDLSAVQTNDLLLIQHTGAYSFAVSNHFNGRLGPAHLIIRSDGRTSMAMAPEDDFFELATLSALPGAMQQNVPWEVITPNRVGSLSSPYLRAHIREDSYEVLEVKKQDRYYIYKIAASSPLGVLSLPFALRIVADLGVVSLLDVIGKETKDVPVWGTRLAMTADRLLPTKRPLILKVWISSRHSLPTQKPSFDVRFEFNDGDFAGTVRAAY
ncbi:pyridoxal-dependent decarboxylase, pyridoxal binding domain protein [Piscinibacter aquaticus]|uniref:Pyridoxal-dependent decarboxylase, pyridoxal binding domain protein n=1 Tax=Piscinibacter aquaticus TaxID=392597 RepID=A0A5C6TQ97_9BURK|nr:pyridoxal-dependent decarboxylase, pyridoxal binding domain protein [Piscinibacter aquaticus]